MPASGIVVIALAGLLSGCLAVEEPPRPAATEQAPQAFVPRRGDPEPARSATPRPLTDRRIAELLREAACWYDDPTASGCLPPGPDVVGAIEEMALSGDRRFAAPLVDMLWLEVGWKRFVTEALRRITGLTMADPADWYAWVAEEDPPLPNDYATWKGRLLSLVDARFAEMIGDRLGERVPPEQLIWGRLRIDGLAPLRAPSTVHRVEERYLNRGDTVFGLVIEDEARAYPERIVAWHGVIADELGGAPVLLVHCDSCGSVVAFHGVASDGAAYTLGTSGLVYRSRRLLYDEETFSLWDPISGAAVAGPLAAAGVRLDPLPLIRATWDGWSDRHHDSTVLSLDTGYVRNYAEGEALHRVAEAEGPLFPLTEIDDRLPPMERVLGLDVGGETRAYRLGQIERQGIVHDVLGGQPIVIVSPGPGRGVSVYEAHEVTFTEIAGAEDRLRLVDDELVNWFMDEQALVNTRNSRTRPALPVRIASWFAWADLYPGTEIWEP